MPVDYSKFKDIADSDEEPLWETPAGKAYKGLPPKALEALDGAGEALKRRQRPCLCFLDFATDPAKLREHAQELAQSGGSLPSSRSLGRVVVQLDQVEHAPILCENFRSLCTGERGTGVGGNRLHYKGRALDFILPRYCVQLSIRNEYSCWGKYLPDECLAIPGVAFDRPGLLAVGNHGPNTNTCSFMITLHAAEHLDGHNQILGRVVRGMEVLRAIELLPTDRSERSFAEKNVKTWFGGKPRVDVVVEACGELSEVEAKELLEATAEDGDAFPEHPLDFSCSGDREALFQAQEQLRQIGNRHFKEKRFEAALEKYKKAATYLEPLVQAQHRDEFADEDVRTWMAGGLRPKERTEVMRALFTIKLNVCQVLLLTGELRPAIAVADEVLLELVGKDSTKGHGALPNDPLVVKALFRRAKARLELSKRPGEVPLLEEAIHDLRRASALDEANAEVAALLEVALSEQRQADAAGRKIFEGMLRRDPFETEAR